MKNFFLGFLMAAILLTGGYFAYTHWSGKTAVSAAHKVKYHCAMHPTYISDKPGDCPICGMKLVPMEEDKPDSHAGHSAEGTGMAGERKILYWQDPMHPQYKSDKPGKAPDCGMDLVPVYADEASGSENSPAVEGYATVKIPQDRIQKMGITLEAARRIELDQSLRTYGRVTYAEPNVYHVHTKFEGFIEDLYVNYVGQFVKKGEPLFSIYSPELYATQEEYLLALRARKQMQGNGSYWKESAGSVDLVAASERRLGLWDIGQDQIRELEKTAKPVRNLIFNSPVSGYVTAKTALHGVRVMPGDTLYDIVDLSTVWVQADVYEMNLPLVALGQPASLTLPYLPGKVWHGRVVFINPTVDPATRTVKARLEFANPTGELKPDMYADVIIGGAKGSRLAVPESAVISTGERNIVFVAKGGGVFEPREVTLGVKVLNFDEIKQGISEGETIVTGANFLLDSESKLKATTSGASGGHKHGS